MSAAVRFNIFAAIAVPYLLLLLTGFDTFAWYLKPLLLLPLMAMVWYRVTLQHQKLVLAALLFSWLGDVTLMFADASEVYFIVGLLLFLTAHLMYIWLFLKMQTHKQREGQNRGIAAVVASYLILMLYVLFPKLGALKIPVSIYAIVISTMLFTAFRGRLYWHLKASRLLAYGAVAFVISDSLLAFNKFYAPYPQASFLIMATYLGAQFLIVQGVLLQNKKR